MKSLLKFLALKFLTAKELNSVLVERLIGADAVTKINDAVVVGEIAQIRNTIVRKKAIRDLVKANAPALTNEAVEVVVSVYEF